MDVGTQTRLMGLTIRSFAVLCGAVLAVAPALPAVAATQAMMVDCAGQPGCFSPNPITIPAGASVSWSNAASASHTATADVGAWTTGVVAPGQTSAGIAFPNPGTFTYHCSIHPSMHGMIVVTAAGGASPAPAPTPRALAAGGGGPGVALTLLLGLLALSLGLALIRRRAAP